MSDPATVDPVLLDLTPPARRILALGGQDDAFAAAYRARYPLCE